MSGSSYIGKVIDNYRIVEVIGEGGMGVVFKAIHTKLDKMVALKMIAPGLSANSKFIRRFQTEAKALAKLQDPNIVAIHDLRSIENQWFIAMEYVEGKDLYDIVAKNGAFSWQDSIAVIKQILSAVGHAHKAGIVHRDLKPHNIMLTTNNQVKITDFGLAKDESNTMRTMTVASGGTLNYMSPEHVKGFSYIEKRSDLYCVGIILYEMVTGEVPFKDVKSDFDIRESILRRDFDTPTKINKKIPTELEAIIMKSIEKHPEDRFQTAEQMLQMIYDFEKGKKFTYKSKRRSNKSKNVLTKLTYAAVFLFILMITGYFTGLFNNIANNESVEREVSPEITIKSDPIEAMVYLNNKIIGKTPLSNFVIQNGKYSLKLEKEAFIVIDTLIIVEKGEQLFFKFNLSPVEKIAKKEGLIRKQIIAKTPEVNGLSNASLFIKSNPIGANVFINNQAKGTTPLKLTGLNSGEYQIRIARDGYKDYIENLQYSDKDNKTINANLSMISGSLLINTIPEDVTLEVDGEIYQVKNGEIQLSEVGVGQKKIKISKNGYFEYNQIVEIMQDQETKLEATLSHLIGKLSVTIRPWGKVYINNQLQENVTDTKYEGEFAVDTYLLKVEHPTLGFWQKEITISENNQTEIKINFNKKIPLTISAFKENGEPFAGEILIDDIPTGKTTPQEIKVPVGYHRILVEKPGYSVDKGYKELLVEENYKDPIVFILKENEKVN